jgi:hypothetical protein
MNPLPVGYCAAVQLSVLDAAGREPPRNPLGQRVTLADFDMEVASPNAGSVVGRYLDAYHWSVCGCQGAAPGTPATITASYPARTLSASARVPGASVQVSARFELAAPKGDVNPPGCTAAASRAAPAARTRATQPVATIASTPVTPDGALPAVVTLPPVSPPVAVTPTPAPTPPANVGEAIPKDAGITRVGPVVPAPVTVNFELNAQGSWYEPDPVTMSFHLSVSGSWYEPAPVTITFDLTATGDWNEPVRSPGRPIHPAPPGR